jgi:RNA polymerase sigma factor (TIGR02999 family)
MSRVAELAPTRPSHQQLFVSLYSELRRLARKKLRQGGASHAMGATTLLHEVYLTVHARDGVVFPDHARFLAYASRAMRGLIIDHVRSRHALKRGAGFEITSLPTEMPEQVAESNELQRLNEAVEQLAAADARLAEVVDLKYFGGFSFAEIAALRDRSERTVQRDWEKARMLLHNYLSGAEADSVTLGNEKFPNNESCRVGMGGCICDCP